MATTIDGITYDNDTDGTKKNDIIDQFGVLPCTVNVGDLKNVNPSIFMVSLMVHVIFIRPL